VSQDERVDTALQVLGLGALVAVIAGGCRRFNWPAPLLLIGAGVMVSFIPGVLQVELNPDVVLVGLLPPLLYAAALRTSLLDFRTNKLAIALLSVGLVAFSTVAVGLVAWLVVPAASLAAAFALGAVVAPPDAVAAAAVARRVGMPRRIVTLLENESLVNDAAALVALNTAVAALTHHVTAVEVVGRFAWAAGGGVLIGLAVAALLNLVRGHLEDPVLDTTLSFIAPYLAFLPAQAANSSGVLAVVVTGLLLGHRSPVVQSAASRISENINWRTVQFLLENVVFVLIGLQLRELARGVQHSGVAPGIVVGTCLAVLAATIGARALWIFGFAAGFRLLPRTRPLAWSWPVAAVTSWAGMRGVVTLAAAYLLPDETPHRDLLRLAAFAVVAGTLLIQGLSLPALVRRLGLPAPDPAEDALRTATLVSDAAQAGIRRLEEVRSGDDPPQIYDQLVARAEVRSNAAWERLGRPQAEQETPSATYRRLRLQMLDAERHRILEARNTGHYDDEVLRAAMTAVDLEESLLDRVDDAENRLEDELQAPRRGSGDCKHLLDAPRSARPDTPGRCGDCVQEGTTWVRLRMWLTCGHVGCCDSSVGRHAERHFHRTQHPVMRSVEPGEAWRWCYLDRALG